MNSETIDREAIRRIVDAFYTKALADEILGTVFRAQISDWPAHLERMTSFWASALLRERSYVGHPLQMHRSIPGLTIGMFSIWLGLFEETVLDELGNSDAARTMIDSATRMGKYMVRNLDAAQTPMRLNSDGRIQLDPDGPILVDTGYRQ